MRPTVLIIGQNIERQVIDLGEKDVLLDEQYRAWLDICFDRRTLKINGFQRQFNQINLLEKALRNLELYPSLATHLQDFSTRIVLKSGANFKVLKTTSAEDFLWSEPQRPPRVLVLLESADLSAQAFLEIEQYLRRYPSIKFVLEYRPELLKSTFGQKLLKRADLIWLDLVSHQTSETEALVERFPFNQQIILINHASSLSLSDKLRTYQLTSVTYKCLQPFEWLALAIKILHHDLDIEDRLELMVRLSKTLIVPNSAASKLESLTTQESCDYDIELVRGQVNHLKNIIRRIRFVQTSGLILDLSNEKLNVVAELLAVRDLPHKVSAVVVQQKHYLELLRRVPELIKRLKQTKVVLGYTLPMQSVNLHSSGRELVTEVKELNAELYRTEHLKPHLLKATADFLFGQDTPSDRAILANVRHLAIFAKHCVARGIMPVIELRVTLLVSFDGRSGAIALEFMRLLRSLETELKNYKNDPRAVMIWLNLPTQQGKMAAVGVLHNWSQAILSQAVKRHLQTNNLNFTTDLALDDFCDFHQRYFPIVCRAANLAQLNEVPLTPEQLRIRFSQFLVDL